MINQYPYISEETLINKLNKSFFNPNWSFSLVSDAVNYAYNEALRNNHLTGIYTVNYLNESITIYMDNGIFDTGYGAYRYTLDEFLELFGDYLND